MVLDYRFDVFDESLNRIRFGEYRIIREYDISGEVFQYWYDGDITLRVPLRLLLKVPFNRFLFRNGKIIW